MKKLILFFGMLILISGCSRAAVRIHGASGQFKPAVTNYKSNKQFPFAIIVNSPVDRRGDYFDRKVAGTSWKGCRTDTYYGEKAIPIIKGEVKRELKSSGLFSSSGEELILDIEIRAFCSQVRGFIFARVGGISSFKFSLKSQNSIIFSKVYEKVITDGDPEYTGSSVAFIEQAMRVTMSDSLREVIKELLEDIEKIEI